MPERPRIFIDGEAGTTGLGIRERLLALSTVELRSLPAEKRKDLEARRAIMSEVDLVVLCLPDEAAIEAAAIAENLGPSAPKLLDASTAHRVHPDWVYGFPELALGQAEKIAAAQRVANPGCYPTGAIALIRPILDAGVLPPDYPVSINAVSGYSGGGKAMIEAHERSGGPAFEIYGLNFQHKHVPETQLYSGLTRRPIFIPSVGHFRQGMLVCIPLHLDTLSGGASGRDLYHVLAARYVGCPLIQVAPPEPLRLEPEGLNDTDRMELRVYASEVHRQALLVARLDNLGKGASGAAVQNIGLMLGLDMQAGEKASANA